MPSRGRIARSAAVADQIGDAGTTLVDCRHASIIAHLTDLLTRGDHSVILARYEHSDKGRRSLTMWRSFAASSRTSTRARPMKVTRGGSRSRTTWTQSDSPQSSRRCARIQASTCRRRRYPTLATMPNASPSGCRCSRSAAATAGRGCSATPAGTAGWPSSKARAVRTRWCAAITAGLIASTARCRTFPTPTRSPTSTVHPRIGRGRQP